jgi:periplasmic protein TonB
MSAASAAHPVPSAGPFSPAESPSFMTSRLIVIVAVIGCHVLGLWALQNGLLRRMVETIVPVQVLADFIEMPKPRAEPAPPPPQPRPEPPRPRPVTPRAPVPAPQPEPQPVADAAPQAPIEVAAPVQPEPQPDTATPASSASPSDKPPAPPVIVLPSSEATYLNNPPPAYPPLSVRLNEQGTVRLRAYVGTDGKASSITVLRSSGFPRLDQAAVESVYRWRFVPGTRDGQPIPMWTEVPVRFQLNLNP